MMNIKLIFCCIGLLSIFLVSCTHKTESLSEDDTIMIEPGINQLDSITTQKILETALINGYIDIERWQEHYGYDIKLYFKADLGYLPYYMLTFRHPDRIPLGSTEFIEEYISMGVDAIDDPKLFNLIKEDVTALNDYLEKHTFEESNDSSQHLKRTIYEYPDSFIGGDALFSGYYLDSFTCNETDTLRVRAVVHNDREALAALEKYYRDNGDDKGIAIYYKVMLGYEGNGDLAERFYRVLEPYFNETPKFRTAVREVLLRAALCDHNKRAQELCDSLGFSLCDYRITLPEK